MIKSVYTKDYFSGKGSFFYKLGYGRFSKIYFHNLFKPLKPYLKEIKGGKVLDVGCAYGFMLQKFPESFHKYGLDISEYAIDEAKKKVPEATLKVGGIESKLHFPEDFFDVVIFNDVIEHLKNPRRALENILKMLKREGILYLNTPNLNWLRRKVFAYADKKEHHIYLFPRKDLSDLLNGVGFKVIDHWTYTSVLYFTLLRVHSGIGHEAAFICKKL